LSNDVAVTVTEALVLRPLLEDRGRMHHRVNPYPGARRQNKTEMFSDHDETSPSIAAVSVAATEKALLPIRRRVRCTTRLPHDEARSVDRPGILATDVRRSEFT